MTPPSPFTQIVQMLSALLGGVWGRLFLSRKDKAEANVLMETMRAFDELLAQWRAGTLVPEVEAPARVRKTRSPSPRTRSASPRGPRPAKPEARRRIIRLRPVNWSVIPRSIESRRKRRKVTVPRCGEWSG